MWKGKRKRREAQFATEEEKNGVTEGGGGGKKDFFWGEPCNLGCAETHKKGRLFFFILWSLSGVSYPLPRPLPPLTAKIARGRCALLGRMRCLHFRGNFAKRNIFKKILFLWRKCLCAVRQKFCFCGFFFFGQDFGPKFFGVWHLVESLKKKREREMFSPS